MLRENLICKLLRKQLPDGEGSKSESDEEEAGKPGGAFSPRKMGDSCSSRNRTLLTSQSSMKWSPNEQYQSKAIPSRESGNCLRHNAELPAVGPHCRRNLLMCSRGSPKPLYWTNLGSGYPSGNGLSYTSGGCMCTGLKPPISLWSRANSNI